MANASETLGTPNPAPGYRLRPDHIVAYQAFSGVVIIKFDGEEIAHIMIYDQVGKVVHQTELKP